MIQAIPRAPPRVAEWGAMLVRSDERTAERRRSIASGERSRAGGIAVSPRLQVLNNHIALDNQAHSAKRSSRRGPSGCRYRRLRALPTGHPSWPHSGGPRAPSPKAPTNRQEPEFPRGNSLRKPSARRSQKTGVRHCLAACRTWGPHALVGESWAPSDTRTRCISRRNIEIGQATTSLLDRRKSPTGC